MAISGALLSAIARITHPELHAAGIASLQSVADADPDLREVIRAWPTAFNQVQIICNRETPFHRDNAGLGPWYDLLLTLGSYDRAALVLRTLGMQVAYMPGSIVMLCSLMVHHGVSAVDGDRICQSWYMSEALHTAKRVGLASWMYHK